ncbi:MAG: hypothetical protein ACPG32_12725, partial [Akkermansiaceae bacterium]
MQTDRKKRATIGRWIAFFLALITVAGYGLWVMRVNVTPQKPREINDYKVWEQDVISVASSLPVQDGGRIKPFSTWAGFALLKIHGDRSMTISINGKKTKLGPEEILLDCLFRPEVAKNLPIFRVDDSHVISSLASHEIPEEVRRMSGMGSAVPQDAIDAVIKGKKRRDRYSYNELEPIVPLLITRAQQIREKKPEEIAKQAENVTEEDRRTSDFANKVWFFLQLTGHMDFARADINLQEGTPEASRKEMVRMSYWVQAFQALRQAVSQMRSNQGANEQLPRHLLDLLSDLQQRVTRSSEAFHFIPAYNEENETWDPIGKRMQKVIEGDLTHLKPLIEDMKMLEEASLAIQAGKQAKFARELGTFKHSIQNRIGATATAKLESEVQYTRMQYFYRALLIFIFAFVFIMISWISPQSTWAKFIYWLTVALSIGALILMTTGIIHRCILMERSPVGNLYDTIIFIAATGVLVLLLTELLTRRMVSLGLAVFMGMACMFLARRFEMGDAKDHMDPLVAVLKSNFWLSTHVVTVTIGYMGGLAAAGISVIYLFARVLGID